MRFIATEIWIRSRIIEAPDAETAFEISAPDPPPDGSGLNLSNWHIFPTEPTNPVPVKTFGERKAN